MRTENKLALIGNTTLRVLPAVLRVSAAVVRMAPVGKIFSSSKAAEARLVKKGQSPGSYTLQVAGVGPGDEVWVSTLTFAASVNPVLNEGATPVSVASDEHSWDPQLFVEVLEGRGGPHAPRRVVVPGAVDRSGRPLLPGW